jgi:hypothetical protein
MKLFFLALIFSFFASGCGKINTEAQIKASNNNLSNFPASNTGKVIVSNVNKSTPNPNTLDISTVDFKNFTFPEFKLGKSEQTFTLKNAVAESSNNYPKYTLRKTYYFDLTGDAKDEAISHIIADGCQLGCDSSSLFYIHTVDGDKAKLFWRIAIGGDAFGGLKAANFKAKEIILDVFGNCTLNNSVIIPNVDMTKNSSLKTNQFTRFVFSRIENGFIQTGRELLPLPKNTNAADYRSQISFGEDL